MRLRSVGLLAAASALVLAPSGAAAAEDGDDSHVTVPYAVTQLEVVCGGEQVPVTYDGRLTTVELTTGAGSSGLWLRLVTDLHWTQGGVDHVGRASASFSLPPSGRVTTYRFQGGAVGSDGSRVRIHEVVHARWSSEVEAVVLVEFDRVECS